MKNGIENEPGSGDLRCCCGSLIARVIENQIEIKCRRCKRIHRIPIEAPAGDAGLPHRNEAGGPSRVKSSGPSERNAAGRTMEEDHD